MPKKLRAGIVGLGVGERHVQGYFSHPHIELDAPNVSKLEKEYLCECIDSGFVSTFGPFVPKFEKEFSKYLKVEKAVSTQSGTAAIHISLKELGIGEGDEVIVPALTFVATVNPIIYVGASCVFVDIDEETWNINPEEIKKVISKKTKAVIPVHLYGNPCNMDEIMSIAKRYNLYVIEDAAESLGAQYKGRHVGTFGDLGCFSFNGNKIITTGGGGMVVGNNIERLNHIEFLVNQARDQTKGYYHSEIGFNYRMTNMEAALGLAQFRSLENFLAKKRTFNKIYQEELKRLKIIQFQKEYTNATSSYWLNCVIFVKDVDIVALQKKLQQRGIPTGRIFMPVTELPPYKKNRQQEYVCAKRIYERGLCLPGSTLNSEEDIYYVCKVMKEVI